MSSDFIQMVSDWHTTRYSVPNIVSSKAPCAFFLAPTVPDNAQQVIDSFFKRHGLNLTCLCFMNQKDKEAFPPVEGLTLVTLEEFPDLKVKPKFIFNLRGFFPLMFMDYFKAYGANMFAFGDPAWLYNRYVVDLPKLYSVHEMLADEESKKVFRAYMTARVTNLLKDYRFAPEPQYFLEGFFPTTGDIAIDGGAFDGATSIDFAKQGAKVYAFEMNENNYKNCIARIDNWGLGGITLENLGLSNQESESSYLKGGAGSRKDPKGTLIAKFIDLDTYVARNNLPRVDYIKLDIEGAELDMLHGAAKTITRWKPKMAVSAYHKVEDLWALATYIKSLRSDYEFKFRHYRIDSTDYLFNDEQRAIFRNFGLSYFCPSHCECVLYCR